MTPMESIKERAAALGLDACGMTPLSCLPALRRALQAAGPVPFTPADPSARTDAEAVLPGARSAIVVLFPYKPACAEPGNIALYARPRDYHRINRQYLETLKEALLPLFPDERFLAITDTSPLADRWLAHCAGLGFFGKNHCLIYPRYGSWFTIGALLTTMTLPGTAPLSSQCGACTRCLDACPGRALSETGMDRLRCKSYLTQKKDPLSEEDQKILRRTPLIFGCDECQRVCPWNENALPSPLPEIQEGRIPSLTAEALESLSARGFDRMYRSYAFAWRGKKLLLRNLRLLRDSAKE